jgi:hypothetical protein
MNDFGVVVQRFYVKYVEKETLDWDHSVNPPRIIKKEVVKVPVEYALIGPRGGTNKTLTPWRIKDLQRTLPPEHGQPSLWDHVKPLYEAWKAGETAPNRGTPLAALGTLTEEDIDALHLNSIRSIEDLAAITDGQMPDIRVYSLRSKRDQARAWVDSTDQRNTANELATLREQVAALQSALEGRDNTEEPIKRRPGRPRKEDPEAEVEAA